VENIPLYYNKICGGGYKLADELGVSSVEIIATMEKLGVPVELPNPYMSIDDAQRIRASFKKRSGFHSKTPHSLFLLSFH